MFSRGIGRLTYVTVDWSHEMCLHIHGIGIVQEMLSSSGEPSASYSGRSSSVTNG